MTPEQQQSIIRYLAERLGWPEKYYSIEMPGWTLHLEQLDDPNLVILFASYVKAKMYEIGWVTWWDFRDRFAFYKRGKGCAAWAILQAAAEALGMEQEQTK